MRRQSKRAVLQLVRVERVIYLNVAKDLLIVITIFLANNLTRIPPEGGVSFLGSCRVHIRRYNCSKDTMLGRSCLSYLLRQVFSLSHSFGLMLS